MQILGFGGVGGLGVGGDTIGGGVWGSGDRAHIYMQKCWFASFFQWVLMEFNNV